MAKPVRGLLVIASLILGAALLPPAALAQTGLRELPIAFTANEVQFDEKEGLVTAEGNVEISRTGRTLYADRVTYNQNTGIVTATGNVRVVEPTGDVYFAESMEVREDLKVGLIETLRLLMVDKTRVAAESAVRTEGNQTELSRAVFSPCRLCEEDPSRPPVWQIKAVKVVHDQDEHMIEYKDAVLEIAGVPVFYTPYFAHPDPTVERKSGFLAPTITSSDDLGLFVRVPYHFAFSEYEDATIEPFHASKENPGGFVQYRRHFGNGQLRFEGSLTASDLITKNGREKLDTLRGHMNFRGDFDYDKTWRWGFDVNRVTDDTYLRRYDISSASDLTSRGFVEGFRDRSYASAEVYAFQGLRTNDVRGEFPQVAPLLNYNLVTDPTSYGAYWTLDANAMSLTRTEGADSRRMSLKGGWHLRTIGTLGQVVDFSATVQSDLYSVSDVTNEEDPTDTEFSGLLGRIFPQASFSVRYPLVSTAGSLRQLVEPVVAIVAAPNGNNSPLIPNEDSRALEFDETDLLIADRFSGLDRVDSGQRVDYGLNLGLYGPRGGSITAFLGQSYRLREASEFSAGTGLEEQVSDVVGNVKLTPSNYLDLVYRFRYDADDSTVKRNEVTVRTGPNFFRITADYIFLEASPLFSSAVDREQIRYGGVLRMTENWAVRGRTTRDLTGDNNTLSMAYGLRYTDNCLDVAVELKRDFFQDRDLEPEDKIVFQSFFKHLGGGSLAPAGFGAEED